MAYKSLNPFRKTHIMFAVGDPGDWETMFNLKLKLKTHKFDGLEAKGCYIEDGYLYVKRNFKWNGSNVVKDTEWCLLASLVHDCLCLLLRVNGLGGFKGFWKRRKADIIYKEICIAQGMWSAWATVRLTGLRLASPFQALKYKILH